MKQKKRDESRAFVEKSEWIVVNQLNSPRKKGKRKVSEQEEKFKKEMLEGSFQ